MKQQAREMKPHVPKLNPPKQFKPQAYEVAEWVDPFSWQKMSAAGRADSRAPNPLLLAELNRRREPLEEYPLDTLVMVGSVVKAGQTMALLQMDRMIHAVKVGDHIGQNYGRVVGINETGLTVREVVQDATGDWVERMGGLKLQEKTQ
jgi:type IV pilus assembly protein PilP